MQTTDKATTKQRTHWQDSKAQHALTTALLQQRTKVIRNILTYARKHHIRWRRHLLV